MNLAIEIPDDLSATLQERWGDVSAHAREAVAIEAYRSEALTAHQVGQLLGHASRWETEAFLKQAQAWLDYTEADLEQDLLTLRQTRDS